jgi:hypothetical protein
MWKASAARLLTVVAASIVGCASAPDLTTQPGRRLYLDEALEKHVPKQFGCNEWSMKFVRSEKQGNASFDYYDFEGCAQRTEFVTLVEESSSGAVLTSVGAAPAETDFLDAAKAQLIKTAEFDTDCKQLEMTFLNALITAGRGQFEGTVGVTGCGKKATYHTVCQHVDYTAGKHKISCSNVATTKNDDKPDAK